jgi:hypothetical protein
LQAVCPTAAMPGLWKTRNRGEVTPKDIRSDAGTDSRPEHRGNNLFTNHSSLREFRFPEKLVSNFDSAPSARKEG